MSWRFIYTPQERYPSNRHNLPNSDYDHPDWFRYLANVAIHFVWSYWAYKLHSCPLWLSTNSELQWLIDILCILLQFLLVILCLRSNKKWQDNIKIYLRFWGWEVKGSVLGSCAIEMGFCIGRMGARGGGSWHLPPPLDTSNLKKKS
jgi:hypothetical protein